MKTLKASRFKSLDDACGHYLSKVDEWAAYRRYIDPAQEAIYRRKTLEANAGGGPLLDAEADALCINKLTLCEQVKAAEAASQGAWAAIEIQRVKAKADIRKAATPAQMCAIYKTLKEQANGSTNELRSDEPMAG